MSGRTLTATSMAFTDQRLRPLLLILLVIVPAYAITRSIAITQATPRRIPLPGQLAVTTGPGRMMLDGAFSPGFHAAGPLAIAPGWTVALTLTVGFALRRAVGTRT